MERPIRRDARLAIDAGHLHQIDAAPQNPRDQTGELDAQYLRHCRAMAQRSQCSQAFKRKLRALASSNRGGDIGRGGGCFPNRMLRGGWRFFP